MTTREHLGEPICQHQWHSDDKGTSGRTDLPASRAKTMHSLMAVRRYPHCAVGKTSEILRLPAQSSNARPQNEAEFKPMRVANCMGHQSKCCVPHDYDVLKQDRGQQAITQQFLQRSWITNCRRWDCQSHDLSFLLSPVGVSNHGPFRTRDKTSKLQRKMFQAKHYEYVF